MFDMQGIPHLFSCILVFVSHIILKSSTIVGYNLVTNKVERDEEKIHLLWLVDYVNNSKHSFFGVCFGCSVFCPDNTSNNDQLCSKTILLSWHHLSKMKHNNNSFSIKIYVLFKQ
jgi:Pyruvate/2-oxoacid:ferredoxin oxidoreductase delta subunit